MTAFEVSVIYDGKPKPRATYGTLSLASAAAERLSLVVPERVEVRSVDRDYTVLAVYEAGKRTSLTQEVPA